jgi:hypothetical protein
MKQRFLHSSHVMDNMLEQESPATRTFVLDMDGEAVAFPKHPLTSGDRRWKGIAFSAMRASQSALHGKTFRGVHGSRHGTFLVRENPNIRFRCAPLAFGRCGTFLLLSDQ